MSRYMARVSVSVLWPIQPWTSHPASRPAHRPIGDVHAVGGLRVLDAWLHGESILPPKGELPLLQRTVYKRLTSRNPPFTRLVRLRGQFLAKVLLGEEDPGFRSG